MSSVIGSYVQRFEACVDVDEEVLSYLANFLEDTEDDEIDSEEIVEMFLTYLPGFEEVPNYREEVSKIVQLVKDNQAVEEEAPACIDASAVAESMRRHFSLASSSTASQPTTPAADAVAEDPLAGRARTESELSEQQAETGETVDTATVDSLSQLYPHLPRWFVARTLRSAQGDVEQAAATLLDAPEDLPSEVPRKPTRATVTTDTATLDEEVRNKIINRYSLQEEKENATTKACRIDSRRVGQHDRDERVRYFQGRVVSTKGDKFSTGSKKKDDD